MIEKYYKQTFDKINMDVAVKQRIRDEIMKSSSRKGRKKVPLSVHIGLAAAAAFALIICIPQTRALVLAAGDYVAGLFTDNAETVTVPSQAVPADSSLWKPPALDIYYAGNNFKATLWNYNWKYVDSNKTTHMAVNSTAHPRNSKPVHICLENDVNTLELDFSLVPESVKVRSWDMKYANDAAAYDNNYTEIEVLTIKKDDGQVYTAQLPDTGAMIVEITGEWKYGTSSYCIEIVPKETDNRKWYLDIEIPEECLYSQYSDYTGFYGGYYILPQAYTVSKKLQRYCPRPDWTSYGLVTRLPADSVDIDFGADHAPDSNAHNNFEPANRTVQEYIRSFQLDSDNDWYVMMFSEEHELYWESQLQDIEKRGITPDKDELYSRYWVFWYVKEDADMYYMLSLAANKFSQEEAEAIADSISTMP